MNGEVIIVTCGAWCRVCGTEDNLAYRERSRMTLCESCHKDTPEKATVAEFCAATGLNKDEPGFSNWWEDYKYSTYGDPKEYWDSCTA